MATDGEDKGFNWALIVNIGLLGVIIFGGWFATFSNPVNEKFTVLAANNATAIANLRAEVVELIVAEEKARSLALTAAERQTKQSEDSVTRRFVAQDKSNDDLNASIVRRFAIHEKTADELNAEIKAIKILIEQRRMEAAASSINRREFDIYSKEHDALMAQLLARADDLSRRIIALNDRLHLHERDDREHGNGKAK